MIRFLLLTVFSLTFAAPVQSQKVHRAAKAMNELKFEKSFELFEEVLEKEPNNVVALVGYAKAHLKENEITKKVIPIELLQLYYDHLVKGKANYLYIKEEEAKLLFTDLGVFNEYSIDSLLAQTSNLIWNNYIQEETSITKFEYFQSHYYKENDQNPAMLVGYKLDKLYYDSLSKVNTFSAYNFYLNKFDKSAYKKGHYSNEAKSRILEIEFQEANEANGIDKLNNFIIKNKIKNFESIAKTTFERLLILAIKEIEKREYNRAVSSPGVDLLEQFIEKYTTAEQLEAAKDSIEHRYYTRAIRNQNQTEYEIFLKKFNGSAFKNEIEDSLASVYFRNALISGNKTGFNEFIITASGFHKSSLIQNLIDSTNSKIYNIEFTEASNSNELITLLEFCRRYKNSGFTNLAIIRKKLFTSWEQSIIKQSNSPDENGLINFIYEFNEEPASSFNKVIDATKTGLTNYAERLKPILVMDLLVNASKTYNSIYYSMSSEKIENLSNLIASRLYVINSTSNNDILINLKKLNAESAPSLLDLFNCFFVNFKISNSYIESFFEFNEQAFLFGYQTKEKFNVKLVLWDDVEMKYKEIDPTGKDSGLFKSFIARYNITNMASYMNSTRTKYNYVIIGSKITQESMLNLYNQSPK